MSLTGDGEPEVIDAMAVSDGFFPILGVTPIMGRWFTPEEDGRGKDFVVILSESLWQRRYGADPRVLGRKLLFNNQSVTIVGVMPADFRFPQSKADIWTPLALDRARALKTGRYLETIARLNPDATIAGAQADMNTIALQLQKERPDFDSKWGITVVGLREQAIGNVRTPLLVLLGAVGLVLLIACVNVANLMLMRAAGRSQEIAIRAALGAGAARIARQLLVESMVIALLGGTAGLLTGIWAVKLLTSALPDTANYANLTINYGGLKTVHIDATVFAFALAASLLTGVLFGLAPALRAVRTDVHEALRGGGRSIAGQHGGLRGMLVVAEVALSVMLLVGAGLLIRSFARLSQIDPGFDARHVLTLQISEDGRFRGNPPGLLDFNMRMLEEVRSVPGVEAAGTRHFLPLGRIIPGTGFWRADQPLPNPGEEPITEVLCVLPGYFAAMSIPIERGRVFTKADRDGAPLTVVVNQTLARQLFPNESPVGKRLYIQWGRPQDTYEIVGVVGDVHQQSMDGAVKAEVFLPTLQAPTTPVYLVARIRRDPKQLALAIEERIRSLDRNLPISDVKTMDEYVSTAVAAPRFNAILLGGFAFLALALSAVGIFAVISYSVAQRTQEIGIRRSLGATTAGVMGLVLGQGMRLTAIGVLLGLAGALAVSREIKSLLYGVTPTDALTFVNVWVGLAVVALIACYLPALRAAHLDPMVALRRE